MAKQTPKKTQPAKSPTQPAHAVQMLQNDHKLIENLFDQYRSASANEKMLIAGRLFTELKIHTKLEEELFYPAVQSKLNAGESLDWPPQLNGFDASEDEADEIVVGDGIQGMKSEFEEETDDEMMVTAYEDHQTVKELIEQLKALDSQGSDYQELFTELEEAVLEHMFVEEDTILPIAAAELDVQLLGAEMQRRRDDLSSDLAA